MDWVKIFILLIAINFIVIFTGIMIENSEVTNAQSIVTFMLLSILLLLLAMCVVIIRCIYKPLIHVVLHVQEKITLWGEKNYKKFSFDDFLDIDEAIDNFFDEKQSLLMKEKNAEILMKTAEINNLQDQMNPHFLYNTLEVIRGQALIQGDMKVAEMTNAFANYFRYNISRTESFVLLKDELKNIQSYFTIQKYRFGDKMNFQIVFQDGEREMLENCFVPKLIIQPIAENSIYHGLELKVGKGTLIIRISAADNHVLISVSDDGVGMDPKKLQNLKDYIRGTAPDQTFGNRTEHTGTALANIYKRLKLYWGDSAYMAITSVLGFGTEIHLAFPIEFEKLEKL